jgi:hypothetical protein
MKKIIITLVLAFVAGYLVNEHTRADQIAPVLHQVESATQTIQTDHVALARDLARRERRDEEMFALFDRVLTIIETDVNKKVAGARSTDYNKEQ